MQSNQNIKEECISYKTAHLAKIRGFDGFYYAEYYDEYGREWFGFSSNLADYEDKCTKCSQSMLQKWLRDKHRIHIKIDMVKPDNFTSFVISMDNMEILDESMWFSSYEQALEYSLYQALCIIID